MVIYHNINALFICHNLSYISNQINTHMLRLSTGKRINSAADDPAGFAISEGMEGQIRGLRQATRNVQDAISVAQIADGSLKEVHSMLDRMKELTVQAANDTNSTSERDAIKNEIDQLNAEIQHISGSSDFNEKKLLDGTNTSLNIQVGPNGGDSVQFTLPNISSIVTSLKNIDVSSNQNAEKSTKIVDDAIDGISTARSSLGAYENRFEYIIDENNNYEENLTAAQSRITDADMAEEYMEYAKYNILQQVNLALLTQASQQPKMILYLLDTLKNS